MTRTFFLYYLIHIHVTFLCIFFFLLYHHSFFVHFSILRFSVFPFLFHRRRHNRHHHFPISILPRLFSFSYIASVSLPGSHFLSSIFVCLFVCPSVSLSVSLSLSLSISPVYNYMTFCACFDRNGSCFEQVIINQ